MYIQFVYTGVSGARVGQNIGKFNAPHAIYMELLTDHVLSKDEIDTRGYGQKRTVLFN